MSAAALFILIGTATANAETVFVEGTLDCGQWIEARKNSRSSTLEHYVLGLLNGLALGKGAEFWRAEGQAKPSREAIYLWMDNYCTANPLEDVFKAAIALYIERSGWKPQ